MLLKQKLRNYEEYSYELIRLSTKSDFSKNANFPFLKYLTKWLWYYRQSDGYESFDSVQYKFRIDSVALEKFYDESVNQGKLKADWLDYELDFKSMILYDRSNYLSYEVIRRPKFE